MITYVWQPAQFLDMPPGALVSEDTVVLRQLGNETQNFGFIN